MRTINFKVLLVTAFLSANIARGIGGGLYEQEMVCINAKTDAFMDGQKNIRYFSGDWQDGDVVTATLDLTGQIVGARKQGIVWRYDNSGTFTDVSYPWHWEGAKPETVRTEVTR